MLVSDEVLRSKTSWVSEVEQNLRTAGILYVLFTQVSPNPRAEEIMNGAAVFAREQCNGIVALGGR